jgi:hypothetical protein
MSSVREGRMEQRYKRTGGVFLGIVFAAALAVPIMSNLKGERTTRISGNEVDFGLGFLIGLAFVSLVTAVVAFARANVARRTPV